MTKVNRTNLYDEANQFAQDVVLPLVGNESDPALFLSGVIEQAINGQVPRWFENRVEAAISNGTLEFDNISMLEFFRAVVVELPTLLL